MLTIVRVLVLILFYLSIYVPTVSAELYQNQDYNFQMSIPDGWENVQDINRKYLLNKKIVKYPKTDQQEWAGFAFSAKPDNSNTDTATTEGLTPEQRKDFLNSMIKNVVKKYPSAVNTYSDYIVLGKNGFLVTKFKINTQVNIVSVTALSHRTIYFGILVTGNSGQYEQQFFDMLKTLRPIVGDSDGDFEEEIMYYNDIAK